MEQDLHSNVIFFTFIACQLPERDDEEKTRKGGKGRGTNTEKDKDRRVKGKIA